MRQTHAQLVKERDALLRHCEHQHEAIKHLFSMIEGRIEISPGYKLQPVKVEEQKA